MKHPELLRNGPIFDRVDENTKSPVPHFVEKDEDTVSRTTFELSFMSNGAGYGFPCDSAGNILDEGRGGQSRSEESRKSEALAKSQDWEKIEIVPWTHTDRLCGCGSGEPREEEYDARGIFLTHACQACRGRKLSRYRRDVLEDGGYEACEDIDGD